MEADFFLAFFIMLLACALGSLRPQKAKREAQFLGRNGWKHIPMIFRMRRHNRSASFLRGI
jgi:hypothetical protein